jgi:hypothetical protein
MATNVAIGRRCPVRADLVVGRGAAGPGCASSRSGVDPEQLSGVVAEEATASCVVGEGVGQLLQVSQVGRAVVGVREVRRPQEALGTDCLKARGATPRTSMSTISNGSLAVSVM